VLAIIAIIVSISVLIAMMSVGKMLGRGMSLQQAYIQEQFPVEQNAAKIQNQSNLISNEKDLEFSGREWSVISLLLFSSLLVLVIFLITRRIAHSPAQ
jgi:hypothetical protein